MEIKTSYLFATQIVLQRFLTWGMLVIGGVLAPSMVWALQCGGYGQHITTYRSCAGPGSTNCTTVESITYYPLPPCPPPPSPPPPPPPPPELQCIASAHGAYGSYVSNAKRLVLDGASDRCMNMHRVEYMAYSLTGNDNAYSQCVRGEEQVYADMVAGAKAVLDAKLQGCSK